MIRRVYTSYFYQVRFFTPNMIPISTAIWDPKWYHNFRGQDYVYTDKRGVINGLRVSTLSPKQCGDYCVECQRTGDPNTCEFIKEYRDYLDTIDFGSFMVNLEKSLNILEHRYEIPDEIIPVFLVHEAPDTHCSERETIQEWFRKHGLECKEWSRWEMM